MWNMMSIYADSVRYTPPIWSCESTRCLRWLNLAQPTHKSCVIVGLTADRALSVTLHVFQRWLLRTVRYEYHRRLGRHARITWSHWNHSSMSRQTWLNCCQMIYQCRIFCQTTYTRTSIMSANECICFCFTGSIRSGQMNVTLLPVATETAIIMI